MQTSVAPVAVPPARVSPPVTPVPPGEKSTDPTRRSRLLAITGAAVAVAGLAMLGLVWEHSFGQQAPRRPALAFSTASAEANPASSPATAAPSSSASLSPQQAAIGLAALLGHSVTDRASVNGAFTDVETCGPRQAQDVRTFSQAAGSRRQLLAQLASMPGRSALSPSMLADLASAWQASASADTDLAAWAHDQATGGCSAGNQSDPHFQAATGPNRQATAGKRAFLRLWDPLARQYGLTTYQQNQI